MKFLLARCNEITEKKRTLKVARNSEISVTIIIQCFLGFRLTIPNEIFARPNCIIDTNPINLLIYLVFS